MKKKLLRQTAIPVLTAACVFSQVGMAFSAISGSNTGYTTAQAYTQGTWKQEAQGWKYYDANQKPSTGWIYTESGWYYIDPATGFMRTGWLQDEKGRWFYLESAADQGGIEGRLHTGWMKDPSGSWYFMNTVPGSDFGVMLTGWQWIDNSCYYFGTDATGNIGKLYRNTTTPDGYNVNADGRWVNADGSIRHDQKGIVSTVKADGTPIEKESSTDSDDSESGSSSSGGSHSSGNSGNGSSNNGNNSNSGGSNNSGSNDNNGSNNNGGSNSDNGSNNNGSDNNGSNSGDQGSDDETTVSVIDEKKTRIMNVDSLGKWLTITFDEGYNAGNCVVTVDGKDVTSSLAKVTDDGSIAKLPLVGTPGTVTAISKEDSKKSESVVLNEKADEDSVYTEDGYLPEKLLGHGAIPVWDYCLTNYDDEGNVRVTPSRTTIALDAVREAHPSYSPDAEIDENGNGTVTIMFNYNTAEEKEWFDAISGLELVQYNENRNTINDHLEFESKTNVPHGHGKVGTLTLNLGQKNFRSNGRYYVRVRSEAGKSAMASIHIVNQEAPTLLISESAISGRNLHFTVKDMTYGVTVPIERVTLTDPTGDTKELNKIDDWYLIGDLFVLYNDVNAENGRNNIPYNGTYTITLYSNGFKTVNKSFHVTGGEDVPAAMQISTLSVDAVSRATSSGSTSGSGDGGSATTSADLIFDSDLLVNANILNDMGEQNDAVNSIIDYRNMLSSVDSVFDTGDTTYYTWLDYYNAVSDAALEGTVLTFAEYKENGADTLNRPHAVKEVLEDGLLGDIQYSDSYGRFDAPAVTVTSATEGKDLVLSCQDVDYLKKVTDLYLNGDWKELDSNKYTVDAAAGTITIKAGALKSGEVTVTIDASGYKSQTVKVNYSKVVEENLSLKVNYEEGKNAFTPDETGKATVSFTVNGSEGDFLKYLTYDTSVVLDKDTNQETRVWTSGVGGSDSVYYVVEEGSNVITLYNVTPGTHTITIQAKAEYYPDSLSAEFKVDEVKKEETDDIVMTVESVEKGYSDNYIIYFKSADEDNSVNTYLNALKDTVNTEITVNSTRYSYDDSFLSNGSTTYKIGMGAYGSGLSLMTGAFNTSGNTTITIKVAGYQTLTFTLDKSGKVTDSTPDVNEDKDAPSFAAQEITAGEKLKLICDDKNYLQSVSVLVGSEELKAKYSDSALIVNTAGLSAGKVTLTLKADGYKDQTISLTVKEVKNDLLNAPEFDSSSFVKAIFGDDDYYHVSFVGTENDIYEYLKLVAKSGRVYVNNVLYKSTSSFWKSKISYKTSNDPDYGGKAIYLDLTADGFNRATNTVKIVLDGYNDLEFTVDAADTQEAKIEINEIPVAAVAPDTDSEFDFSDSETVVNDSQEEIIKVSDSEEIDEIETIDSVIDKTESEDSEIEEIAEIEESDSNEEDSSEISTDKQ